MVLGVILGAIATGVLAQITPDTPTVRWAAYLVMVGLGIGVGINQPYTAIQVVLR